METKAVIATVKKSPFLFLFENDKPVQICPLCQNDHACMIGDIYIGKVSKIIPNINAAFIEIHPGVHCYCALSDAENGIFTEKRGKKPLAVGDELLVQVKKEAAKSKQPTLTTSLSITDPYCVLSNSDHTMGVSSKIGKHRREEIKSWLTEYPDPHFGIIVRTNAESLSKEQLFSHIRKREEAFADLLENAGMRTCFSCLQKSSSSLSRILEGMNRQQLTSIIVENLSFYDELKSSFTGSAPELLDKLVLYDDPAYSLSKLYNLERELEHALSERIWMKSGAFLIIQPTEALTVIDVNSGKNIRGKGNQYLEINMEAAKEAARQIRLRNLSGIIIIDFINLSDEEERARLLTEMRQLVAKDCVKTDVIDITKLELMEITRKKTSMPLSEAIKKAGISI